LDSNISILRVDEDLAKNKLSTYVVTDRNEIQVTDFVFSKAKVVNSVRYPKCTVQISIL
jgi:hypothetical protein